MEVTKLIWYICPHSNHPPRPKSYITPHHQHPQGKFANTLLSLNG